MRDVTAWTWEQVIKKDLNPEWNEKFELMVNDVNDSLRVQVNSIQAILCSGNGVPLLMMLLPFLAEC